MRKGEQMKLFLEQNTKNEEEYKDYNVLMEFIVTCTKCIHKAESVQVYKAFCKRKKCHSCINSYFFKDN